MRIVPLFLRSTRVHKYTSLFLLSLLIFQLLSISDAVGQHPLLRSREVTRAKTGVVIESAILADDKGKVFIEVPEDVTVKTFVGDDDQRPTAFDGFILAPEVVDLPERFPIRRYRPYVVFEFLTDGGEDVRFTDQYFGLKEKQLRKLETRQEYFVRKRLKAFFPVPKTANLGQPSLYFFDPHRKNWIRLGGLLEETSDPDMLLFSLTISRTGLFALMDENPAPIYSDEFNTDPAVIEMADESPFPSVIQEAIEEDTTFLPEDELYDEESIDALFESSPETHDIPSLQDNSGEVPSLEPLSQEVLEQSLPKAAEPLEPIKKENIRDIHYDPSQNTSYLDLYNAGGGTSKPTIIYLHGGDWAGGSRKNLSKSMIDFFDQRGMILAAVDFRPIQRVPFDQQRVTFREQLSDIAKAIGWIYKNIDQYGGNPKNIHLIGHGSGAHSAVLLTTDPKYLNAQNVPHRFIQSVIALDSYAYDIPRAVTSAASHSIASLSGILEERFGGAVTQAEASPSAYLTQHRPEPVYFILYSHAFPVQQHDPNAKQTLSEDQAHNFANKLEAQNISVVLENAGENQSHGSLILNLGTTGDIVTDKISNYYESLIDIKADPNMQPLETVTDEELALGTADKDFNLSANSFDTQIPTDAQLPQTGPVANFYLILSLLIALITRFEYRRLKGYW